MIIVNKIIRQQTAEVGVTDREEGPQRGYMKPKYTKK